MIQFFLLFDAQQARSAWERSPVVEDGFFASAIVASDDRANPAGGLTYPFSHFLWRVALLHQPQNMPMRPLDGIGSTSIAFVQLCCGKFGGHGHSFGHASIIHYLNGFDITSHWLNLI